MRKKVSVSVRETVRAPVARPKGRQTPCALTVWRLSGFTREFKGI